MDARRLWRLVNFAILFAARLRRGSRLRLVCECRRWSCVGKVGISVATYETMRGRHECVVLHGHQEPAEERVLWASQDFLATGGHRAA